MSTIELRNVTKKFGTFTAVREVDLEVGAGEVVCLLGPSGCGKTTTLRIVAGLEVATAGDVIIAGQKMNEWTPEQRNIAMVFQFYALYPSLTVGENLGFPLHAEGISAAERQRRVAEVAATLQLEHILDRLPAQIAEGEKQRVAVARAIIRDPNCFLFDEPLSRLDVELRQTMRGQIKQVLEGLSKATIIVTHDQLEALTMASRIAIMREGLIEQIGTPHEVFTRPANAFVASFVGTPQMNLIDAELVGVEGETAEIRMEGTVIRLPVDPAVAGLDPGSISVGMRPRSVVLASEAGPRAFTASAELIEPMGAETLIHARTVQGDDIRVVVPRERRVAVGEVLHLEPEAGQTHVFDFDRKGGAHMSEKSRGMSRSLALRVEFGIIGLGILALAMIFQPFALPIFSVGCMLVVLAALANNLLPFAEPGKPLRGVIFAGLIVALVFCTAVLLAIVSAHLYGLLFLTAPATPSLVAPRPPFWTHPMVWTLAGLAALFAFLVRSVARKG